MLFDCCYPTVSQLLANCYPTVTQLLPNCYPTATQLSPNCYPTFPNFCDQKWRSLWCTHPSLCSSLHSRQVQQSARPKSVFQLHHRPLQPRHIVGRLGRLFAVCGRNVFECTSFYSYVNMYPLEESYSPPSKIDVFGSLTTMRPMRPMRPIRWKATTKPRIARIVGSASTRTNKASTNANNARRASTTIKRGKAPSASVARVARVGDGATRWN